VRNVDSASEPVSARLYAMLLDWPASGRRPSLRVYEALGVSASLSESGEEAQASFLANCQR
jgi:hypothetical protein